ncbi:hypothetical protein ACP3P8_14385 [Pseudomonas aeruginosa]
MFSGKTDDRGLWAGIQAGVLFFLAALACIYLSRQPATIAAIWLPNAILTAALLRAAAPVAGDPALPAVANLAANRLYGDSLWMSAAFLPANLSEAIFAAMLLRINRVREDFEFNLHSAVRVLWAGALIPPCSAPRWARCWSASSAWGVSRKCGRAGTWAMRWACSRCCRYAWPATWRPGVTLCRGGREWTTRCSCW